MSDPAVAVAGGARDDLAALLADLPDPLAAVESVLLSQSFRLYAEAAWPHVESRPLHWGWHLDAYVLHLEAVARGRIKRLLFNVPPGTSKSTTVAVLFQTWVWTWQPSAKFIFWSYDQILSTRDSLKCRRLIQSSWYQARWGHVFQLTGDQNLKTHFENDKGGYRLATTPGGHGTGEHPDYKVVDDPQDAKGAGSLTERRSLREWRGGTMATRGAAADIDAAEIVVCQRLHEDDFSALVLEEGDWDHVMIPMRYEPSRAKVTSLGWRDPRTVAGELLDPVRFPEPTVARIEERLGPYGAAGQMQQRPAPAEGGILKRHHFRFWVPKGQADRLGPVRDDRGNEYLVVELPAAGMELGTGWDQLIHSWDMSFKGVVQAMRSGRKPDFVSGGVWGRRWADMFLLDRVSARMSFVETCKAVIQMAQDYPAQVKLVEDKANGPAVMDFLRRRVFGLTPVTPHGSKFTRVTTAAGSQGDRDARAMSMEALLAAGHMHVPHPTLAPWVWDYVGALADFPNSTYDDDVDMTSQAVLYLQPWVYRAEDAVHQEALTLGKPVESTREIMARRIADQIAREREALSLGGRRRR